ncbi:transcription initiation factor TFIID subunit 12 [Nematocida sp. LUAm3]|nr:transcription initiation factor TFIID subunit 12 [Nematocida sp. LUAm3]KAI5175917.1 transcription initiation factor TFIID subunit 12 [Nematocida sp. LUAm2]KAI5178701.1 transcription initiation factor TFIID subunit 12 [Nematocida sp. LUAm1]
MRNDEHALQKRIQHLQNMLGEINRYLQGASSKPPPMVSRLLEEKARITAQLRELNNTYSHRVGEVNRLGRPPTEMYLADKQEKRKENIHDGPEQELLEKKIEIEEILKEMGIQPNIDNQVKKVLLGAADIFIDNIIATSCSLARNREAQEITKADIQAAMKLERNMELYNSYIPTRSREPDKEHIKKIQLIRKDQKKSSGSGTK